MNIVSFCTVLTIVCVYGIPERRQYLLKEDMLNIIYLKTNTDSKPWTAYIDELLHRLKNVRSPGSVLVPLLRSTTSALQWCSIPAWHAGLFNHSSGNSINTIRNNISEWLPCGVNVIQKYISSTTGEATITIHVNHQLHINVTFIEINIDSIVLETDNVLLPEFAGQDNINNIYFYSLYL